MEILPTKSLTDEDGPIFGKLNVSLGKLQRSGLPVADGIVVTPPDLKLKSTLEHYDFGKREVFEQSLTLVKKEINSIPIPDIIAGEVKGRKTFLLNEELINSSKNLWLALLDTWFKQIRERLWNKGFYTGITEGLDPQIVIFVKKIKAHGRTYFDPLQDDTVINIRVGKLHPNDLKIIDELVRKADKKLFIPHEYEWIVDGGVKIAGLKPYTQPVVTQYPDVSIQHTPGVGKKSAVKIFLDFSTGLVVEKDVDGIFIASEKIFDLNKPTDSFEELVFKLVESAVTFPNSPVLFKLADKSEGMGKVRGALRLLHQKSLFDPLVEVLDFARHKKGLNNIHIVVPFVRAVSEFLQIKRELAVKKLTRKNSLKLWIEISVPENILNLESYLLQGVDGIVLNLDELSSFLGGYDTALQEVNFYKNQINGLLKFLEDGLRLLHKSKIPFISYGSLSLHPEVLDFLVEKAAFGIVVERYEAHSASELLNMAEKKMILRRTS